MPAVLETQDDVEAFLSGLVSTCERGDYSPELRRVAEVNAGYLGQYMAQSRSPDGRPYAPLKHKRPPGHNQQSGPLIDFGELLLSLVGEGKGGIENVSPRELVQGTEHTKTTRGKSINIRAHRRRKPGRKRKTLHVEAYTRRGSPRQVPIALIHQYGAPGANIPPRPFVGWSEQMLAEAVETVGRGLVARVGDL